MFPTPDTRPGYAFQDPGTGGAIAGGIQAVLQALLQKQKMEQQQAELGLEQQRAAQSAKYQNTLLAQEDARQKASQAAMLAQRQDATQVGQAIQQMGQPVTQPVQLPSHLGGGGVYSLPTGQTTTPEQAAQSLPGYLVPQFYEQGSPAIREARDRATEAKALKRQAATEAALRKMPGLKAINEFVDQAVQDNPEADPAAIRGAALSIMGPMVPEATLHAIRTKLGLVEGTPQETTLKIYEDWMRERAQAQFRPPKEGAGKLKVVPLQIKQAHLQNEQTVKDLDAFIARLGGDPTDPSKDAPVNPGGAFGLGNAVPWIRDGWGNYQKNVRKNTQFAEMESMVGKIRVRPVFNTAGKVVTGTEKAEINAILNNMIGPPDQQIRRARDLKAWLLNSNEGMRAAYAEGYEPMGSTYTDPAEAMNAEIPPFRPRGAP
jgi:hypothetical protein